MILAGFDIATDEVWKVIPDYPSYAVSSRGRVKRIVKGKSNATVVGKILKPTVGGRQRCYARVTLYRDDVPRFVSVHRLVLSAFVGPAPSDMHHGAHNDGDPRNNTPQNLRWALPVENSADIKKHGRLLSGHSHPNSRLSPAQVLAAREAYEGGAQIKRLAQAMGVGETTMARVVHGETYK